MLNIFNKKIYINKDNKDTCIITGGTKGIGREIAKCCANEGLNLIIIARNENELINIKKMLNEINQNIEIHIIEKDLFNKNAAKELFNHIFLENNFSNLRINNLVNNAGHYERGEFINESLEEIEKIIQLNILFLTSFCHLIANNGKIFMKMIKQ
jgi:short-subunit dehydrogenase